MKNRMKRIGYESWTIEYDIFDLIDLFKVFIISMINMTLHKKT